MTGENEKEKEKKMNTLEEMPYVLVVGGREAEKNGFRAKPRKRGHRC